MTPRDIAAGFRATAPEFGTYAYAMSLNVLGEALKNAGASDHVLRAIVVAASLSDIFAASPKHNVGQGLLVEGIYRTQMDQN